MKRDQANRDHVNNVSVIIKDIKKVVHNAKKDYNLVIRACRVINKNKVQDNNKNKVQGNKKEIHKPIVNNKIDINQEKITMLRKNYVLLAKDMELVLRKSIYERFLSRKFRGKATSNGEIMLVSRRHKINSTINIVNDEISVIFERNKKLKYYYTELFVNTNIIIIKNEFIRYCRYSMESVVKSAYTEIFNDKIMTYAA